MTVKDNPSPQAHATTRSLPTDTLVVLLLACGPTLVYGGVYFAALCGAGWPSSTGYLITLITNGATAVTAYLLYTALYTPGKLPHVSSGGRRIRVCLLVTLASLALVPWLPTSLALRGVAEAALVTWLAVRVARSHGIALESAPRPCDRRHRRVTMWMLWLIVVFCVLGAALRRGLDVLLTRFPGDMPLLRPGQGGTPGIETADDLLLMIARSAAIEDLVLVAGGVALLSAARRPVWQIYLLVIVVEVVVHAHYGLGAITLALFAGVRVWLYLRYRRVLPMIAAHVLFDVVVNVPWIAGAVAGDAALLVSTAGVGVLTWYAWRTGTSEAAAKTPALKEAS
ncbi:hypothetical protein [Streptomyces acidiscabies]|uniref:CAAX amino terminal protease self-immunity n=1 Tax=Streptomyces acidiscabies TaxID=42234 RepID=A0ABU4MCL8_9ACTN|nr:hypothetical protein [Streptomyces acidiscabies]MDX3024952.1 hypothetical protein [Streptomyces acidiscabies]